MDASLVKKLKDMTNAGLMDCKKALEESNENIDEAVKWLREKGISKAAKKADRIAAEGLADIMIEGNVAAVAEVNSETDFVAKNEEFKSLVNNILTAIVKNDVKTNEDVLAKEVEGATIESLIINKTATIGEKLSFRRFARIEKSDNESFGAYLHMGGKIAVLITLEGASEEVAKQVAMHAAAMRPTVVRRDELAEDVVAKEREILKEQAMNEGKPAEIAEKMVEGRLLKFYQESCLEEQSFVMDDSINVGTFVKNNGGKIVSMVRFEVGEGMAKKEENFAEEVAKQMGE